MNEMFGITDIYAIVLFLVQAIMTGFVADSKGRSGGGWFVLALFFPLISMLAVGLAQPKAEAEEESEKQNHLEQYNAI